MVSLSTTPFLPFTAKNASTRIPPPTSFSYSKQRSNRDPRKVVCACIAPPQNFKSQDSSAIHFNGSSKSEQLSTARDHEDDSDVLIECRDVYKSFGEKKILNGVSFKIKHGEAVGIIGPSGTGKSTVLKIIAGLLAPDKGEVYIRGKKRVGLVSDDDISGLRIGLVFQSAALFDSLTVRENVGFLLYEHSSMSEDQISELVTETLAAVGLKVLLYDEPTAGLDPIASTVVEDLIRSVHIKGQDARGKPGNISSYVVVTHQHSTIKRAIDRLLFLHKGKIVWEGMTHEFTTSTNPIVQQVTRSCAGLSYRRGCSLDPEPT
ncbi:protein TRIGALACTOSYLDIACYLGLYCEROL 3, chloroplastic-like isoform X3 [Glycine soja]|uniref:Protein TRIGALACTOSYLDIACYLGLYCEROL 3, chloroplastic isoform C n=1 Tax=Glycine soja TaxID=3848 RepID=A0A445FWT9_GLYSO|nr:protein TRIGALACTOSYLDIACYLGLYCEROL 3, chloroplastic-like isoform X3 [Glycine soja]RZB53351.1 Protein TRIGALACTOSYLDIACYLGLYCEROL 3, chloroplastic isoform C [Glycine soja]